MSSALKWFTGGGPLQMAKSPPFTIDAPGATPVEGETLPRRHPKAKDGLITRPHPDVDTVFALLRYSADTHAGERCVGTRRLVQMHKELRKVPKLVDGKTQMVDKEWQYLEMSDYSYMTYAEYEAQVLSMASGLRRLGLARGDKVHLFATTSANWLGMAHACSAQAMTIVTAYDTLGASGVEHTLVQSKPRAMYLDPHLLKTAAKPLEKATSVKLVIYNDHTISQPTPQSDIDAFKAAHPELTVVSVSELIALGEDHPCPPSPPSPDDLYCIMYTSGSTGPPKGVPVTHGGFVAGVAGLYFTINESVTENEVILAYLPLAHIFEMVLENLVLFVGATLGYGSTRTLSDTMVRHCAGDMRALKPTVMVGVPQIWETVKKGVVGGVDASPLPVRGLFWGAVAAKSFLVRHNLPGQALLDGAVFGRVRALTGGRLRFVVNGASGIGDATAHFMSMVVAPMISGYGLTETCGNGALGDPLQFCLGGAIGPVTPAVEMKLVSIPELGYHAHASPPRGEILLRGAPVLAAYYENPDETAAAVTRDGWFRTGDIGEFDANGHVRVVDRVKNLVKLQGGEYVALEKLEAVYRGSRAVQNIMVHGSGAHARPVAVVCVNEGVVRDMAAGLGVGPRGVLGDGAVAGAVLGDLLAQGRRAGLAGLEMVAGVVLTDDEWTPVNGLVTATQKVNRRAVRDKYKKEIEKCLNSQQS